MEKGTFSRKSPPPHKTIQNQRIENSACPRRGPGLAVGLSGAEARRDGRGLIHTLINKRANSVAKNSFWDAFIFTDLIRRPVSAAKPRP